MPDVNEKMNEAIESDDFNKIEAIALSGQVAPVRVLLMNGYYETRWIDIKEIPSTYWDDLSSDQKDFVIDAYKNKFNGKKWLDNLANDHDNKVEKEAIKKGTHWSCFIK